MKRYIITINCLTDSKYSGDYQVYGEDLEDALIKATTESRDFGAKGILRCIKYQCLGDVRNI